MFIDVSAPKALEKYTYGVKAKTSPIYARELHQIIHDNDILSPYIVQGL